VPFLCQGSLPGAQRLYADPSVLRASLACHRDCYRWFRQFESISLAPVPVSMMLGHPEGGQDP